MAAETECIGEGSSDFALLRLVESEIEVIVNFRIVVSLCMVDSRGHDAVVHSLNSEESLDSSGRAEKVACHRFSGAEVHLVCVVAEYFHHGLRLRTVADGG